MPFTPISTTISPIQNDLRSPALNGLTLDPALIKLYATKVADQMNSQTVPKLSDLSERIADIIIETSAQGASILELHVIDPYWTLLLSGFISTTDDGYLFPPIDINFPLGTKCWWRLVQCRPSTAIDADANLILTFEDRIASALRDVGGQMMSVSGETLGGFIHRAVTACNQNPDLQSGAGTPPVHVHLIELIDASDPNQTPPTAPPDATRAAKQKAQQKAALAALAAQTKAYAKSLNGVFPPWQTSTAFLDAENNLSQAISTGKFRLVPFSQSGLQLPTPAPPPIAGTRGVPGGRP